MLGIKITLSEVMMRGGVWHFECHHISETSPEVEDTSQEG